MFFALDSEQLAIGHAVRDLVADRFGPDWVRESFETAVGPDPSLGHPVDLWSAMTEQGWPALTVPTEHGGLGAGLLEATVVATEIGAGTLPGPWRDTVLLAEILHLAGSSTQASFWLPRIAAGEAIGALALDDDPVHVDPDGTVSGQLRRVEYADAAALIVCVGDDANLHLVTPGPGVRTRRRANLDGTTALHEVTLDRVPGELIGDRTTSSLALDRAAVLCAADLTGTARRWLGHTVEHLGSRAQFGVPIGSFQAVKHDLADLQTALSLSGLSVLAAAHLADLDDPGAPLAASVAKAKASDTASAVLAGAVQFHGAMGYTWEHDAHIAYKRVRRLAQRYGSADWHRERIARLALDPIRRSR